MHRAMLIATGFMAVGSTVAYVAVGHGVRADAAASGENADPNRSQEGGDDTTGLSNAAEAEFKALYDAYVKRFQPLRVESERAWWEASTTGTDAARERRTAAESALVELHSDRTTFAKLASFKKSGQIHDPLLQRLLDVMYDKFLPGQADAALQKRIVALESEVDQLFNTHRGKVDGEPRSENEIRDMLANTRDSAVAEKAWKAYMAVGAKIDPKLRELVQLRNRMARELGFDNFFAMKLSLDEVGEDELLELFDELDALTAEPFKRIKKDIDRRMASRFGIPVDELRPWHFGDLFFQEAPGGQSVNLDDVFKGRDMVAIAKKYYASLGMPVDDIIARSDLYEKEGKSPHAFCSDLDREGDIRVLCNLQPSVYWMDTLVHELGHAVYDKYLNPDLPFIIRKASHSITTEGIAMMFGSMVKNEAWLRQALSLPADEAKRIGEAARRTLRIEKLVFSRWTQVMVRFEHGMYTNPDQDLGKLWWDLKARYQRLPSPENVSRPDYAAKMHIVGAPVYYHSYMMGDLFGCQVRHHIASELLGIQDANKTAFFGSEAAGAYLRDKIFRPGNRYPWSELTRRATGEPLTAKYFAEQFIE